jgi:crossover junction endodeoxyribonuclease RuvC
MKIIGVDPGIGRCGWGIIEIRNSKFEIRNCGCIETSSKLSTEKRLVEIYSKISDLIVEYKPEVLSVEELFFNTNSKTAFIVGQARGVILLAASQKNIPVSVFTPLQVKMAITGYGRADKNQIGQMVKNLLKLDKIPKPDDITDALAVALTLAFTNSKLK